MRCNGKGTRREAIPRGSPCPLIQRRGTEDRRSGAPSHLMCCETWTRGGSLKAHWAGVPGFILAPLGDIAGDTGRMLHLQRQGPPSLSPRDRAGNRALSRTREHGGQSITVVSIQQQKRCQRPSCSEAHSCWALRPLSTRARLAPSTVVVHPRHSDGPGQGSNTQPTLWTCIAPTCCAYSSRSSRFTSPRHLSPSRASRQGPTFLVSPATPGGWRL